MSLVCSFIASKLIRSSELIFCGPLFQKILLGKEMALSLSQLPSLMCIRKYREHHVEQGIISSVPGMESLNSQNSPGFWQDLHLQIP